MESARKSPLQSGRIFKTLLLLNTSISLIHQFPLYLIASQHPVLLSPFSLFTFHFPLLPSPFHFYLQHYNPSNQLTKPNHPFDPLISTFLFISLCLGPLTFIFINNSSFDIHIKGKEKSPARIFDTSYKAGRFSSSSVKFSYGPLR